MEQPKNALYDYTDPVVIKQREVRIMSFDSFKDYLKEHYNYSNLEPTWYGRYLGQPFTHETNNLYLFTNSDGSITRFHDDEILIINIIHNSVFFQTMTIVDFYINRVHGFYDISIKTDYKKYNPKN